jgi:hypothetical protein
VSEKLIKLHYIGKCPSCRTKLVTGTPAWWNREVKQVRCEDCHSRGNQGCDTPLHAGALAKHENGSAMQLTVPGAGSGQPGRSALAQFERLHMHREQRIEATWGRYLTPIVKRLSDDPQATRFWATGAWGEQWVGAIYKGSSAIRLCYYTIAGCLVVGATSTTLQSPRPASG